jgi:hypothetical protein
MYEDSVSIKKNVFHKNYLKIFSSQSHTTLTHIATAEIIIAFLAVSSDFSCILRDSFSAIVCSKAHFSCSVIEFPQFLQIKNACQGLLFGHQLLPASISNSHVCSHLSKCIIYSS